MLYTKSFMENTSMSVEQDERVLEAYRQGYADGEDAGERRACRVVMEIVTKKLYEVRKEVLKSKRKTKAKLIELLDDTFGLVDTEDTPK